MCNKTDSNVILEIINDAAQAYKGVIPEDCWHEPYMSRKELKNEIDNGVVFWGFEENFELMGIMGIQDRIDVNLIRHAYIRQRLRQTGIGTRLLKHLESISNKPILVGTWAEAVWAISFYRKNRYLLVNETEKNRLLKKYWSISERQIETSVVLASKKWINARNMKHTE